MSSSTHHELSPEAQQILLRLTQSVDDCDRAMEQIYASSDRRQIAAGVTQLRENLIERFGAEGLEPFGEPGDDFNPQLHQAVDVVESLGVDRPRVLKVHQRGWRAASGALLKPAMVTVSKERGS